MSNDDELLRLFPQLSDTRALDLRLRDVGKPVALDMGATVFRVGSRCAQFLMLLEGSIRVELTALNGRAVVLYRIAPGGTCVLTTSCLLGGGDYPAVAVCETPVRAWAIDAAVFERLLTDSPEFRAFVFASFSARLADVIARMELIALSPIDQRLATEILRRAGEGDAVEATHEALAVEIGSAREVVSRRLKVLERRGILSLGRGHIEIADRRALEGLL